MNPSPDTEDLNQNVNLDTREDYLSFTFDLGDPAQRYLVTDVQRDYNPGGAGKYDNGESIDLSNGWRRYRIPLGDSLRTLFGLPDLTRARPPAQARHTFKAVTLTALYTLGHTGHWVGLTSGCCLTAGALIAYHL